MRSSTISARFGRQLATFVFSRLVFAGNITNSVIFSTGLLVFVVIGLVCSWVGVAGGDLPPYLRGLVINLQLLFFWGSTLQEISKTVYFFVKIASFRRHWSRLLLSWGRGMRFPTISARFGHQLASYIFSRLVFAGDIRNGVFFSTRLLVSVDIGLVRSWVDIPG